MVSEHLDEKGDGVAVPDKRRRRVFSRNHRQQKTKDERNGTGDDVTGLDAPVLEEVAPVSLARLFRYVQDDVHLHMYLLIGLQLCHLVRVNTQYHWFDCCRWRRGSSGMSCMLIVHFLYQHTCHNSLS